MIKTLSTCIPAPFLLVKKTSLPPCSDKNFMDGFDSFVGIIANKVFNSRAMFAKIKKDPILCGAFGECVHSYIERGVVIKWDSSWVNCPPSILLPALFHFTTSNY